MKVVFIMILCLNSFDCLAKDSCSHLIAEKSVQVIEQLNKHSSVVTKSIRHEKEGSLTLSVIESYSGYGGALYKVSRENCKILKVELIEEIDRD